MEQRALTEEHHASVGAIVMASDAEKRSTLQALRTIAGVLTFPLAVALLTSCGNDPGPSQFADRIDRHEYADIVAPSEPVLIRWSFSEARQLAYACEQKVVIHMAFDRMDDEGNPIKADYTIKSVGSWSVTSQGDGTAIVGQTCDNVSAKGTLPDKRVVDKQENAEEFSGTIIEALHEDGGIGDDRSTNDPLLLMLLPLPDTSLSVGESAQVPATLIWRLQELEMTLECQAMITLSRYALVGTRTCAQLEVTVDCDKASIPEGVKGDVDCRFKGESLVYFDVEAGCIVSATAAGVIHFDIDIPMPKLSDLFEAGPDNPILQGMQLSGTLDSYGRIRLK
jgi:hypothetical protein